MSCDRDTVRKELAGFPLQISGDTQAKLRVIRLSGSHDAPLPEVPSGCCLIDLSVDRWNARLSPWPAPALRGGDAFSGDGQCTLVFLGDELLPYLDAALGPDAEYLLAGYSLAGLFALWAGYACDCFAGVAAVSPSLWFPGWSEYTLQRRPRTRAIYLSLGDREEKTRNPILATVGDVIRAQHRLLESEGIPSVLDWNPGNHFRDSEERTAKGITWLIHQLS